MDAGVAAVLGGIVGAFGAIGAGGLSAWGTRQQAKTQARAEVERWHREERQRVYAEYMRTAVSATSHLKGIISDLENLEVSAVERKRETSAEEVRSITSATALVMIQGPPEVSSIALSFAATFDDLMTAMEKWSVSVHDEEGASSTSIHEREIRALVKNLNAWGDKFGVAAHAALSSSGDI